MHFDNVFGLSENTKCLNVSFALQIPQLCSQCTEQCCCNARSKRADSVRAVGNLVTLRKHSEQRVLPTGRRGWCGCHMDGMLVKSYLPMTDSVKSPLLTRYEYQCSSFLSSVIKPQACLKPQHPQSAVILIYSCPS